MLERTSSISETPPNAPPEGILEAWYEVFGDTLARERAELQRSRQLIESQAAQSIAELRARIVELERNLEQSCAPS